MNKNIMKTLFPNEIENVEKGNCPICEKPINEKDFKNDISRKEFEQSGFCQKCQDEIFDNPKS